MADVFISYSHKDSSYAYKIADKLAQYDIEAWIDGRIDYGAQWPRIIEKNLDDCPVFIILLSTNSKNSDWVLNELTYAQRKKKIIVPLLLEGENWLSLESTQYVDVRDCELPPDKYFETIQRHLGETSEERELHKQIVLELSDAVKKKEERKWGIGILETSYGFKLDGNVKLAYFASTISDDDLLCSYDLDYKNKLETVSFWPPNMLRAGMTASLHNYEIIEFKLNQIGSPYQPYHSKPTDFEVQEYASRIIKIHKDHFIPISKINIKVIK